MREQNGDIVYDLDFLDIYWTQVVSNSWIILSEKDENNVRFARLINSDEHPNKSIIDSYEEYPELGLAIASISWHCPPNENFAMVKTLTVNSLYQNSDVGYWIGSALKSYLAFYENIHLIPPPIEQRTLFVNNMLKKWCIDYQDNFTKFLDDDGIYYTYLEWLEKQ